VLALMSGKPRKGDKMMKLVTVPGLTHPITLEVFFQEGGLAVQSNRGDASNPVYRPRAKPAYGVAHLASGVRIGECCFPTIRAAKAYLKDLLALGYDYTGEIDRAWSQAIYDTYIRHRRK
jgi:hypothetical protein